MYRLLIEGNTDLAVSSKTGLGGTKICFDALRNDQIDFYPEYTGTGLLVILQPAEEVSARVMRDKDSTYAFVKQQFEAEYQLEWLPPVGFNNAYALMMRKNMAAQLQLNSISDLTHYLTKKRTP
ncbi:hypothetical protein MKQ70_32815 [Chitinophaga sedimenti]|nr:hypothetical protein [Chitinophaga sedimenti]